MSDLHPFRTVLQNEFKRMRESCNSWEKEAQSDVPEHASGLIRCAIGKAELLMNGKLKQFNNLIDVSANGSGKNVVTLSDLQGFWDLVSLEISDVDNSFTMLNDLKKNGWNESERSSSSGRVQQQSCRPVQRAPLKVKNTQVKVLDVHKIAAKKRLEEVKRKLKSSSENKEDTVAFEVPVFFSLRSPPKGRKEIAASTTKDIHAKTHVPVTVKDFSPCMRVTRSMKKSFKFEDQ